MTREEQLKYEYETKLAELKREQAGCAHEWSTTKYDPEIHRIPEFEERWQGVDCFPVICGWKEETKARWSRTCKKCGKVEYTCKLLPRNYEPAFN